MQLVSMKQDPKDAAEYGSVAPSGEQPLYPYGLSLCLNDESLKKLGMSLPAVGGTFMLMAQVEVTRATANKVQDGEAEVGCDLQITDMQLSPTNAKDAASALWPDKE
jgi:hypothetical protein